MRFLIDQDVYSVTSAFLRDLGHDVVLAAQEGLGQADDARLLEVSQELSRIFVTRDRDFGALVFLKGRRAGVIYLRITPGTLDAVHEELARALTLYTEAELGASFIVVEPGRHRLRRPRAGD